MSKHGLQHKNEVAVLQAQLAIEQGKVQDAESKKVDAHEQLLAWRQAQADVLSTMLPTQHPSSSLDPRLGSTVPRQNVLRFNKAERTSPVAVLRDCRTQQRQSPLDIFAEVYKDVHHHSVGKPGIDTSQRRHNDRPGDCQNDLAEQLNHARSLAHAALKVS
jgi:hypothetical protein